MQTNHCAIYMCACVLFPLVPDPMNADNHRAISFQNGKLYLVVAVDRGQTLAKEGDGGGKGG